MEMWSFETKHCLNFNAQHRKRHDVTNDVKVKFLICGLVGCMKNMLVVSNIFFYEGPPTNVGGALLFSACPSVCPWSL